MLIKILNRIDRRVSLTDAQVTWLAAGLFLAAAIISLGL